MINAERVITDMPIGRMVDKAIDFLAPYFGLDIHDDTYWDEVILPEVKIGEPSCGKDEIFLRLDTDDSTSKGLYVIGHEVGHWYHRLVNPYGFSVLRAGTHVGYNLTERVADYTGLILLAGKNPLTNSQFSLIQLAKMQISEANKRISELERFYTEIEQGLWDFWRRKLTN